MHHRESAEIKELVEFESQIFDGRAFDPTEGDGEMVGSDEGVGPGSGTSSSDEGGGMINKVSSSSDSTSAVDKQLCSFKCVYSQTCSTDAEMAKLVSDAYSCIVKCKSGGKRDKTCETENKCEAKSKDATNKYYASLPANRRHQFWGCYWNKCFYGECHKGSKPEKSKKAKKYLKACSRKCEVETCMEEEVASKLVP